VCGTRFPAVEGISDVDIQVSELIPFLLVRILVMIFDAFYYSFSRDRFDDFKSGVLVSLIMVLPT